MSWCAWEEEREGGRTRRGREDEEDEDGREEQEETRDWKKYLCNATQSCAALIEQKRD